MPALLPVQRRTFSASASICARHCSLSGSSVAGRTTSRSMSLWVSPSPRAVLPNSEACSAGISQEPISPRSRRISSVFAPAICSTALASRWRRFSE